MSATAATTRRNDSSVGNVAVEHRERFAVVRADADLETHHAGVRIVDHAAHLEPADLSGEHAELLDRFGAGRPPITARTAEVFGRAPPSRGKRLGHGRPQGAGRRRATP